MTKENREGAQGLPNASRDSNVIRYQLGRIKYHAEQALRIDLTQPEWEGLDMIRETVTDLLTDRPLEGGAEAESLITKGRKAASKARDSAAEGA